MLRRLAAVLVPVAVAVPLLAAPASASCRSDLMERDMTAGHYWGPGYSSQFWGGYVAVSGTATVTVHGDSLANDVPIYVGQDIPEFTGVVATNTVDATGDFVDCVLI